MSENEGSTTRRALTLIITTHSEPYNAAIYAFSCISTSANKESPILDQGYKITLTKRHSSQRAVSLFHPVPSSPVSEPCLALGSCGIIRPTSKALQLLFNVIFLHNVCKRTAVTISKFRSTDS